MKMAEAPRPIKEMVPLAQCQRGDRLYIRYTPDKGIALTGFIVIERSKLLPNDKIQIKYRKSFGRMNTIQKYTLPSDHLVERIRLPDEREGIVVKSVIGEIIS